MPTILLKQWLRCHSRISVTLTVTTLIEHQQARVGRKRGTQEADRLCSKDEQQTRVHAM